MPTVVNNPNLIRFDLYLDIETDARMIEYLNKFKRKRRMNAELRRMLFAALDGSINAATIIQSRARPAETPAPTNERTMAITAAAPADNAREKMRGMFGTIED